MKDDIDRVLVVMAHPDDPEFGAGGTIARLAQEGKEVAYVVVTSGDKGSSEPDMVSDRLVVIREAEQRAAADVLGVKEVVFLRHTDGEVVPNLRLRRDITREIRRWRPDAVFTHNPTVFYTEGSINHPDHRAVGEATLASVFPTARDRLNFLEQELEGLESHKVKYVYMSFDPGATAYVDISDSIETKIKSLYEHKSQIGNPEGLPKRIRERSAEIAARGREQGQAIREYAEAFRFVDMSPRS